MPYPRANKDNQIPTPCPASPPPLNRLYSDVPINGLPQDGRGGNPQEIPFLGASFIAALSVSRKKQLLGDKIMVPTNFVHRPKCRRHVLAEHLVWLEI